MYLSTVRKLAKRMSVNYYDSLIQISSPALEKNILSYGGWMSKDFSRIAPVIVGFRYSKIDKKQIIKEQSKELLKTIDKSYIQDYDELIPIVVDIENGKVINRIVFWFIPNEDFIEKLPIRYKNELKNEMSAIKDLEQGNKDKKDVCELVSEKSFFGTCRDESGSLSIESIYPNPATNGNIKIDFNLGESRNIKIDVHDINGNFIGNILPLKRLNKGKHILPIELKDLKSGLYLISIRSEKGEIVSSKLIIE